MSKKSKSKGGWKKDSVGHYKAYLKGQQRRYNKPVKGNLGAGIAVAFGFVIIAVGTGYFAPRLMGYMDEFEATVGISQYPNYVCDAFILLLTIIGAVVMLWGWHSWKSKR